MFEAFLRWLSAPSTEPADREHRVQVGAVALLQELAASDHDFQKLERLKIVRSLREDFGYDTELIDALMIEAEEARQGNNALEHLAAMLRKHMSADEKLKMLTAMWRLVLADGKLDPNEDRLIHTFIALLQVDAKKAAAAHAAALAEQVRLDVEDEPC